MGAGALNSIDFSKIRVVGDLDSCWRVHRVCIGLLGACCKGICRRKFMKNLEKIIFFFYFFGLLKSNLKKSPLSSAKWELF